MRLLRVGVIGWTALMALGLALSEGTPVCKGPLILAVSNPEHLTLRRPRYRTGHPWSVTYLLGAALVVPVVGVVHGGGKLRASADVISLRSARS